jgi:hypothetical protein
VEITFYVDQGITSMILANGVALDMLTPASARAGSSLEQSIHG